MSPEMFWHAVGKLATNQPKAYLVLVVAIGRVSNALYYCSDRS